MDQRVEHVLAIMEDNVGGGVSLADMAHFVNLSPSRLRHIFKAETGMTANRYFKELKLQLSTRYLETTFLSVKEIAFRVGFVHEAHFVRDFKKMYGLAPGQYRTRWLALGPREVIEGYIAVSGNEQPPQVIKASCFRKTPNYNIRVLNAGQTTETCALTISRQGFSGSAEDQDAANVICYRE